ncbi:ferric reductase-like transmembrane domain-containing protein [Calothrix sp. FACHB-1219]|uniref:ferredoxin reductase family protein n=1 Tax=unclassified Calothrix TaxID=2619626 RepID=UPI001687290B|nr:MULTISPECIES: ferric reductase-like transmembrane domain-containing protein [unclassified Calothrix]MBD2202629.1 ferric reductase-like transmembrane domain-containing protein [Calothrix sp. FACHB-168]MBD2221741.1 ferric reductase-like transmembrane domain-containing protein [Calothrix sp. FACHB-1219]
MRSLLMKNPVVIGVSWIVAYILIILFPLFILLLYPPTPSDERSFWLEFSAALGFIGLAMMAMQFALTARIKSIEASYGVDLILQFHRYTSIVAFFFILAHPIVLFIHNPETLQLLNFIQAPWRARAAVIATLALIAIIVTSIWRQKLNIPYEPWRIAHGILAVIIVAFGLGHALGVGNYLGLFWKALIWTAIAITALWLLIYVRLIKPYFMQKKPYLVEAAIPQRGNVWNLVLRPRGHDGISFQPGQFAWLTLEISPFRMREHPFSFASSAEKRDRIEFGIKALGDFTNTIKDVKPGTKAFLDGPYGVFTTDLYENTAGFVLIAGGIGITPIISMLFTLAERQDERPLLLIYASKTWEDITYREEIDTLKDKLDLTVIHVLRKPPEDWSGENGYVDQQLLERYIPKRPATRNYFICAAPKMMNEVEKALHNLDVPVTNIHMEHYNLV